MELNEFINKLVKLQNDGHGDLIVRDYLMGEIDKVRKGIHTEYKSGDETDTIIIE